MPQGLEASAPGPSPRKREGCPDGHRSLQPYEARTERCGPFALSSTIPNVPTVAQRYEAAWPIADLREHPDNPRRGDEAAIEASMEKHGFFGAVLVQESTKQIIAGNHRTRVARRRGETTVPVLFVDVDDDQAKRILLVDNRSSDDATYDDAELARLLTEMESDLSGTGFTNADLDELLASLAVPDPNMPRLGDERYTPQWIFDGMALTFDLDVAAPVDVAQRRVPAKRHLTVHDDGLATPWEGLVWMNPPYSAAATWMRKWVEHPDGVCLSIVSNSPYVAEVWEAVDLFVLVPNVGFDTPVNQEGGIGMATFMAARGRGAPGLRKLAEENNWSVVSAQPRPRPAEPMRYR